jgi:hypothetical protein
MSGDDRADTDPVAAIAKALERIADELAELTAILKSTGVPSRSGKKGAIWRDKNKECESSDRILTEVENEDSGNSSWSMGEARSFLDAMKQRSKPSK